MTTSSQFAHYSEPAVEQSGAPSTPVAPPRSQSRASTPAHATALRSSPLSASMSAREQPSASPGHPAIDASTFSSKLQQWKALDRRCPQDAEALTPRQWPPPRQHGTPTPSPRRESKYFSTVRSERLEVPSSKNVWEDTRDDWSGPGSNDLPYAYDSATAMLQHREQRRAANASASSCRADAATILGNVWAGSSRDVTGAGKQPQGRGVPMNMVDAPHNRDQDSINTRTPGESRMRATWSGGVYSGSNTSFLRESAGDPVSDSSAWLTRVSKPSGSEEPSIIRASFQGPGSDGLIDASLLTSTISDTVSFRPVSEMPSPKTRSSLFGVFSSRREAGATPSARAPDERDVWSMRCEMLQSAERGKGNKARAADMTDLPHIGPSQHSVLGLPFNTSSQIAAVAATAGDSSSNRSSLVISTSQPADMLASQKRSCDEGKDCNHTSASEIHKGQCGGNGKGGHGKIRDSNHLERSNVHSNTQRDSQIIEWFCTRKHKKYSLQRKSKLRLVVDELGRICLTRRRSPVLNPIDGANVPDIPQHLDTYGTPSHTGLRDSHHWISSAMKIGPFAKRHHSPTKAPGREDQHNQHHHMTAPAKSRAPDDSSPVAAPAWGEASEEEDVLQLHVAHAHTSEKSALKHVDSMLRLGGRSERHMLEIERISCKEKHKEGPKKKTDESAHANGGASGSHMQHKNKDAAQDDMGKGTLVMKFKDGSSVQLSGMQVQDVASDLEKCMFVWNQRRKKQTTSLDRLVLMAKTKVSWDKPQHRQMLESFWEAVYADTPMPEPSLNVNVSPGWKDMGFQSNDPCTDFRAMGFLGLHCLWYHSTKYPTRVRTIVHAGKPARDFPYAAVGINLVASMVQMLRLGQSGGQADVEGTALFEFFCKMPSGEFAQSDSSIDASGAKGDTQACSAAKEHPYAFEETFCAAYEMLDDMWVEDPPANILFFNTLLERCRELLKQLFDQRCILSLAELRTAIRDYVPTSEHSHQQPLSTITIASSDSTPSASASRQATSQHMDMNWPLPRASSHPGVETRAASLGRTDAHGCTGQSPTMDESAGLASSVTADSTQDDARSPDRAPAGLQSYRRFTGHSTGSSPSKADSLLHETQPSDMPGSMSTVRLLWAPDIVSSAPPASNPASVQPTSVQQVTGKMSPPSGPVNYMLDTDMDSSAPGGGVPRGDCASASELRLQNDSADAEAWCKGSAQRKVEMMKIHMGGIYPESPRGDPRSSAKQIYPPLAAGSGVQTVFDYPTARSGTPAGCGPELPQTAAPDSRMLPFSVSTDHSSDDMPSTTNDHGSSAGGDKRTERLREGEMGVDAPHVKSGTGVTHASDVNVAGGDASASSLHERLLDHDTDEGESGWGGLGKTAQYLQPLPQARKSNIRRLNENGCCIPGLR